MEGITDMSRKAKYDALLIAAVQLHEALSACYEPVELPATVLSGHSRLWGALQGLGAAKTPGFWTAERERQRAIGREQAREELDSQTHDPGASE
jgi:hypothetical protein